MKKKRIRTLLLAMCMAATSCFMGAGASAAINFTVTTDDLNGIKQPSHQFTVYLSPSSQYANLYVNGGNEEMYMRQVAYAMIPYLQQHGINYVMAKEKRAVPQSSWGTLLQDRAAEAKAAGCDLYLAIHSNAAPSASYGTKQGTFIYYYTQKPQSLEWAKLLQSVYCYPDKSLIKLTTNDQLIDMYCPEMPSILVETAYHDNVSDANWIKANINQIAKSLADSVALYREKYYGIPANITSNTPSQSTNDDFSWITGNIPEK